MSMPQRIYDLGVALSKTALVQSKTASAENMQEFQTLLNQSWPVDEVEQAHRTLTRSMYFANKSGFMRYASNPENRVRCLILWTESRQIAAHYRLMGVVHIGWSDDTHSYTVSPYVQQPRDTTEDGDSHPVARRTTRNSRGSRVHTNTPRTHLQAGPSQD